MGGLLRQAPGWIQPEHTAVLSHQIHPLNGSKRNVLQDAVDGDVDRSLGGSILVRHAAFNSLVDAEELIAKSRIDLTEYGLPPGLLLRSNGVVHSKLLRSQH